jgi:hypothetical protein
MDTRTAFIITVFLAAGCHSSTNLAGDSHTDVTTEPAPDGTADVPADTPTEVDALPDAIPDGPPACTPGDCPPSYFCELEPGTCDPAGTGHCIEIPSGCDDYYDPECGCDGVTYGNECERRSASQSLLHRGDCDAAVCAPWLDECPPGEMCEAPPDSCWLDGVTGICTPIRDDCGWLWDPQCGCDGETYANVCERMAAGVWIDHPGECGETCGPDGYPPCATSEFCEYPTSSCGDWGEGECIEAPTTPCPELWDPQCGCDGTTYANTCYRQQARVSLDHRGEC